MIRLDRVELLHWDLQPHQILPLASGTTLITGENGSGKTSILDAIKVALGASRLGGERTVDGYLLKQASALAMVRLVADNRADPDNLHRPFDALHGPASDEVTLAVVFTQDGEDTYQRHYYLLDGDVVPIVDGRPMGRGAAGRRDRAEPRPQTSATEYRERLQRVGIGRQYLKLLCLPQGRIARFCASDGGALFDELYDVIGGRDALVTWEERLRELADRQREHDSERAALERARRDLDLLAERVKRHDEYKATVEELDRYRAALPYAQVAEVRGEVRALRQQLDRCEHELARLTAATEGWSGELVEVTRQVEELAGRQAAIDTEVSELRASRDELTEGIAGRRAHRAQLEQLRERAEGVDPVDLSILTAREETLRRDLATLHSEAQVREAELARLRSDLARVREGLIPLPAEVDAFRATLRHAGIAHHLLAEVLEIDDEAWTEAIEGYLGRRRLAVLVQDPDRWADASELARQARWKYGVLAPDVRGASPADDEGLGPMVRVGERRYASLVARLLRRVMPGEPSSPLSPPRRGAQLAQDGFAVERLEARHTATDDLLLGRRALQRRRERLEVAVARHEAEGRQSETAQSELRLSLGEVGQALEAQRHRLAWEAEQETWAAVRATQARLEGERDRLDEGLGRLEAEQRACAQEATNGAAERATLEARLGRARADATAEASRQEDVASRLAVAEAELGRAMATTPDEAPEALRELLASGTGARTLEALAGKQAESLVRFEDAVRDDLLPVNHARQVGEVAAVEQRLGGLAERLDATQDAAEAAKEQYQRTTRLVFRGYFGRLRVAAAELDFHVEGRLEPREDGHFACSVRVQVGDKPAVQHNSEELSGGQKAALSILMGMTAVSFEQDSAGFFLIDEPFSASDVHKINELGSFLARTGAQYLLSMPTSSDLRECSDWLQAVWTCTRTRGGVDASGELVLAPPVKLGLTVGARR